MPLYSRTATSWDPQIILQCLLLLPLAQRPPCEIARPLFLHRTTARGCRVILHPSPVSTRYYFFIRRLATISNQLILANQQPVGPMFLNDGSFLFGSLALLFYITRERETNSENGMSRRKSAKLLDVWQVLEHLTDGLRTFYTLALRFTFHFARLP